MKTEISMTIEVDLPEDISQEDIEKSVAATRQVYWQLIDKTVPATVTAVEFKEPHE